MERTPSSNFCDNQSCVKPSNNIVFHDMSKHIETTHNFIRDFINKKGNCIGYCPIKYNDVNILMRALCK